MKKSKKDLLVTTNSNLSIMQVNKILQGNNSYSEDQISIHTNDIGLPAQIKIKGDYIGTLNSHRIPFDQEQIAQIQKLLCVAYDNGMRRNAMLIRKILYIRD